MNGLRGKLKYPDFEDFISHYDIICGTDDCYNLNFKGFNCYMNNRVKLSASPSGGLALLVSEKMSKYITVLNKKSHFAIWLKISGEMLQGKDCICANVHIPSENSVYGSINHFDTLVDEITDCKERYNGNICLIGDLSARTSSLTDMTEFDDNIPEFCNLNSDMFDTYNDESDMIRRDQLDVPVERKTSDTDRPNNWGHRLLSLCKSLNLRIMNGRIGKDRQSVRCKGVSVIDYVICSPTLFPLVREFYVNEYGALLSDVHYAVCVSFETCDNMLSNSMNSESLNVNFKTNSSRWNPKLKNGFVCSINEESIRNLHSILDNIGTSNANPHDIQSQIDNALGNLCECLQSAADKTFKPYAQHRIMGDFISQLIFSMRSGMFFFDCNSKYVVLTRS